MALVYPLTFGTLALTAVATVVFQSRAAPSTAPDQPIVLLGGATPKPSSLGTGLAGESEKEKEQQDRKVWLFKLNYLTVYALVMGADWLQGPYIFSLYHDEYSLDLHTIALLFVLGFLSAALSAPFVGRWADRSGRRRLCIVFTITYTLSSFTKFWNYLPLLALGRILGGLSTSLLFTTFESWLVSSSYAILSPDALAALLGRCTLVNGVVASSAGVLSDFVVQRFETYKSPFMVSALLLVIAGCVVASTWGENYGGIEGEQGGGLKGALRVLRKSPALIALLGAQTAFETSMYLFVFLWVPTLQDAVPKIDGKDASMLPLGTIFSTFMIAMSLGSMLYNQLLARKSWIPVDSLLPSYSPRPSALGLPSSPSSSTTSFPPTPASTTFPMTTPASPHSITSTLMSNESDSASPPPSPGAEGSPLLGSSGFFGEFGGPDVDSGYDTPSLKFQAMLLVATLLASALALGSAVVLPSVESKFLTYVFYELCVGLYYPVIGTMRSALLPEEYRATLAATFRVPFNVLVTLALVSGLEMHRTLVAVLSCTLLLCGALGIGAVLSQSGAGDMRGGATHERPRVRQA